MCWAERCHVLPSNKTLTITQTSMNSIENRCCQMKTIISYPQLTLSAGPEAVSDVWQRSKGFGSQQDDPICPAGGNVSQLPALSGGTRTGNQNNHHSSRPIGDSRKCTLDPQSLRTGRRHTHCTGRMVGVAGASGR